jgi:tetratricopeptide (TPR) repeat protein
MGLAARTLSDRDGALRQFERAWQEAPDSTSVLLALINAKVDVGEIVDARELLQHELLKRARLSHRERLELRATVARVAGSWSVAADALQSLADFFPGERQYALWLFDARMHSTSPQRAAEALSRLMPISDPAVALAMTRLDLRQGRLSDALKHAGTALKLADASDADAAGIAARSRLAGLLFAVSDHSGHLEAERLLAEAINLGERGAAPSALLEARIQRFELALEQNDAAAALSQVDAVCAGTDRVTADRVTNRSECARMQAILALAQGHVAEARVRLEQATEGFEKLAWTERLGELRRLEAELELRLGQVSAARARLAEAEQMHRQIGAATQLARSSMVRGDVLAASLQYPAAIEQYRLGLRHYQDGGDGHAAAHALARLAATLPLIGQYDLAEQARFEAADIFQAIDDERGLVELDRATALTAGRTGELDRATRQLESVDLRYMDLGDNDGRIEALAKLVQMYSQGLELTEAQAALHRALELSTTNPLVRAQLALAAADLAMVESDFGAAAVRIADARATLATEGSSVQMHRVDLAQARLLLESGEAEAAERLGRALLADVLRPNPGVQAVAGTGIAEAIPEEDRLATVMLLVQSLSDQRRIDEARWTLENLAMLDVGRVAADLGLRLQMLQAYLSETTTPIERLREVRDLALGQGFRLLALESDARLASALMRNQRDDEGALLADAVSRQASASGAICVVDYLARLRSPLRR